MNFEQMTARDLRYTIPTQETLVEAFEYLLSLGWQPVPANRPDKPPYTFGWWVHPDHPTKCRPVGDSKQFHLAAWDTLKAYVLPERRD